MDMETPHSFDWANDAYVALHSSGSKHQSNNYTIPPALLSQASIERYGQVTPPEEHSPTESFRHASREQSIPVEQLRNETNWRDQQHPSARQPLPTPPDDQQPSPKRRRASRPTLSNHMDDPNPQPPKRKRGRPKSQPQMIDAYTADGFPFQYNSARQSHLEKNRVAAHKCRQRKKEYINGLEGRAREFSAKNKLLKENVAMLREEVLGLKNEVLRHAGCGFWAVDEYLARCAGDLLGMEAPSTQSRHNSNQSDTLSAHHFTEQSHHTERAESVDSNDSDDFEGLELLRDFDDADMDELEKMI